MKRKAYTPRQLLRILRNPEHPQYTLVERAIGSGSMPLETRLEIERLEREDPEFTR